MPTNNTFESGRIFSLTLFVYGGCMSEYSDKIHVFHCNVRLREVKKYNDDECKFFMEYIK